MFPSVTDTGYIAGIAIVMCCVAFIIVIDAFKETVIKALRDERDGIEGTKHWNTKQRLKQVEAELDAALSRERNSNLDKQVGK